MERITKDTAPGDRLGHEFRYYMASGFIDFMDIVVDAACGMGYGSGIIQRNDNPKGISYVGVDKDLSDVVWKNDTSRSFIETDLQTWDPHFGFDVFIGFETVEHLHDYSNYLKVAKRARRWAIFSVPVVPTVHMNPYHVHDFEPGEFPSLFVDDHWQLFQGIGQPSELSEIYVFKRLL